MENRPLLIDLGGLSTCCTNHALETLAKAISGEDDRSHDIWEPHHSPFVNKIIELFTQRGLLMLGGVKKALASWMDGHQHDPLAPPVAKPGYVENWSPAQSDLVHLYLSSLAPSKYTLDDWGLLVDYLLHTFMPADVMRTEAEWLAVRSSIMGRVQASTAAKGATVAQLDPVVAALPLTVAGAQQAFKFGRRMEAVMAYARARCMENATSFSDTARRKIKKAILDHTFSQMQGDPAATRQKLESRLFDEFAALNRDWRMIAVTEAGENANQGFMSMFRPGARLKRVEQYKGACPHCKKIDGVVMTVVSPDAPNKNGDTQVWVGKTNVGRSAASRMRDGDEMVARPADKVWWIAAGTQHPHCRGFWEPVADAGQHDDPDFQKWLDAHLHRHKDSPITGNTPV